MKFRFFTGLDWILLLCQLVLLTFGLTAIWSVAGSLFLQQLLFVGLGIPLYLFFSHIDYRLYPRFRYWLYIGSLIFLVLPIIFGTVTRGSTRWLSLGFFNLQPSEICKPFLIIFFANELSRIEKFSIRSGVRLLLAVFLPVAIIFFQPDLGSAIIVGTVWLTMVIVSEIPFWFIACLLTLAVAGIRLIFPLLKDYQKQRLLVFLNPQNDPTGAGFHALQAKIAVGAGLLWGRGIGRGTQSHLRFLPERHTDFIFASLAEEVGFFGCVVFIITLLCFWLRILLISLRVKDNFGYLVGIGIGGLLFWQASINILINLGLLPITGITLPLVSYGGSSLLSTFICLGIVQSLYRHNHRQTLIEIK